MEYLFLDIFTADRRKCLLGCVYRPNCNICVHPLISILEEISVQYDDILILGDFNNNLLTDNPLITPMLSLHLHPVNTTTPTHFSSSSLIDLVFVNHREKVLLYDQLSASCFSNHDLLYLTYNLFMTARDKYISYRDFRSIDYTMLNLSMNSVYWDRIYDFEDVNDQLGFIHHNVCLLYDMCVPSRTKLIRAKQQAWFSNEIRLLIEKRNDAYCRWKRFRTDNLRAIYNCARREVTKCIRFAKTQFFVGNFPQLLTIDPNGVRYGKLV